MVVVLYCEHFPDSPDGCCGSCHDGANEFDSSLCEIYCPGKRGAYAHVCCRVANTIDADSRNVWAKAMRRQRELWAQRDRLDGVCGEELTNG